MKTSLIVKLNFLILGLGLVIYLIYALNTKGLPAPIKQLFSGPNSLNWCDTRVLGIIRPEEYKLEQVDSQWTVEKEGQLRQANFLEIEKWFVEYCKVPATPQMADGEFRPALLIKFIDGQIELLRHAPGDLFSWKGQVISAPKLTEALAELSGLTSDAQTSEISETKEEIEH